MQITTVGLDLAKRVFQVHAVDASGDVVVRKLASIVTDSNASRSIPTAAFGKS